MKLLWLAILVSTLFACGFNRLGPNYGPTLADLEEAEIPDNPMPVPLVTIDVIEDSYRSALTVARDTNIRHRIQARLADIEMARSEDRQLEAVEQDIFFQDAISMYEELRELDGVSAAQAISNNDRLLYQLSKAYALGGELEKSNAVLAELVKNHPDSGFSAEAEFRRAEEAFSNGDYALAEQLYAEVLVKGKDTPFQQNAEYMLGWSKFKGEKYNPAIRSFLNVMDFMLGEENSLEKLSNSQKNLLSDTLRVCAMSFSYLDGADSITQILEETGSRDYQHLLYMNLGDLYLEQKRYQDSANTYRHYVKLFSTTDQAPTFSEKIIDTYNQGNFPSLVLPAKEEYVRNYGIHSAFWQMRDEPGQSLNRPKLKIFIDELSSDYHARAQALEAKEAAGEKIEGSAVELYSRAAALYLEYTLTFPKDPRAAEITFLMGEAYQGAGELEPAIDSFEAVAYTYLDKVRGAEAGYASILAMDALLPLIPDSAFREEAPAPLLQAQETQETQLTQETQAEPSTVTQTQEQLFTTQKGYWANRKINSAISFADYYPAHPYAPAVLTKTAQEIFESGDVARAVSISKRMTEWQPPPQRDLLKTNWLILAHSQFDLKQFSVAEVSYGRALSYMDADDPDRSQITERIAASAYRLSEEQISGGDKLGAIDRLLAIQTVAPDSDIAISGQFDAANFMMELKLWDRAELTLLDFRKRYPSHSLANTIPAKLVVIYQESEQWAKAAGVLEEMASSGDDPDLRRQSRFLAAELYEKSGRFQDAITQYRDYANNYPRPFDVATESRNKLVELYGQTKDTSKRNYWLNKLIEEDRKAGSQRTARSKYLAAFATVAFANTEFSRYSAIKLTLPLKNSLKKKKAALDKTLDSYKRVLNYGVAEFSTEANNRIGSIYGQLSADLMNSQRPQGLDDLALEQYEILLEEQAYPFEEKAIELHAANSQRAWEGIYDDWVKKSFAELARLLPARYGKKERVSEVSDAIY